MSRRIIMAVVMAGAVLLGTMPMDIYAAQLQRIPDDALSFHVAPDGDDAWDGSEEHPFQTIQRAQLAVRQNNDDMEQDIRVVIHEGTYFMDSTLEFTPEDSADNGYRISYEAAPGEDVLISGGVQLEGKWEDTGNGIYKTNAGDKRFRQLYVNGEKAYRSTTRDIKEDGKYDVNYFRAALDKERSKLMIPKSDFDVSQLTAGELSQVNMVLLQYWSESTIRLDKLLSNDENQCVVKIGDEEHEILKIRQYAQLYDYGNPYYLENALAFVDQGGEWFLDDNTGDLYYKIREGENIENLTMTVPMVETLWRIQGTYDQPIENMEIRGLKFAYSTWMYPSEHGCINAQAGLYNTRVEENNQQWVARPPAGVEISAAKNFVFKHNTVYNMGATGIDLHLGTQNSEIIGNVIRDISGNGIMLAEFSPGEFHIPYNPDDPREICKDDRIQNNYITRIGTDYMGTTAIAAGYPQGAVIEHNEIHDTPYTGITIGWGWHHNQKTPLEYNMIRYNEIYDVVNGLSDGGGIYTLSNQPNSQIVGNYIHDISRNFAATPTGQANFPLAAIYLDEGTQGIRVADNVIADMGDTTKRIHHNTNENGPVTADNTKMLADIIQNAGLEEAYESIKTEGEQEPPVIEQISDLVIEGGNVVVSGKNFGDKEGRISVVYKKLNYEIKSDRIIEWNGKSVIFELPPEIREGEAAVYIETDSGYKAFAKFEVQNKGLLEIEETFDQYNEGSLPINEIWDYQTGAEVIKDQEGNKVLQLTSAGSNAQAFMTRAAENYSLMFDMMLKTEPQERGNGLYLGVKEGLDLEWIANVNSEKFNFCKNGIRIASNDYHIAIDQWQTVKMEVKDNRLKAKIWEKGEEEPDTWMIEVTDEDTAKPIQFQYYHSTKGQMLFDNIWLEEKEAEVPEDMNGEEMHLTFDDMEEGDLQTSEQIILAEGAVIHTDGENKFVILEGNGNENSRIWFEGEYVNYDLQMDVKFEQSLSDGYGGGLYIHLRDDGAEYVRLKYLPANDPVYSFEQNGVSILGASNEIKSEPDVWYTLKVSVKGDQYRAKVWQRDSGEPNEWQIEGESKNPCSGKIKIEYYASSKNISIDNVKVEHLDFSVIDTTKNITGVREEFEKTVWIGRSPYTFGLPDYVTLQINGEASDRVARAAWQYHAYKPKNTEEQVIEGMLKTDYDVKNPDDIKAEAKIITIDDSGLREAVSAAEAKAENAYTKESWSRMETALAEAATLLKGEPESREDTDKKMAALYQAVQDLELNKSMDTLKALLADGESLLNDTKNNLYENEETAYNGEYSKDAYYELEDKLTVAGGVYEELLNNRSLTEQEFEIKLIEAVHTARNGIEKLRDSQIKIRTEALEDLIAAAKEVKAEDYTKESYEHLMEKVQKAEKMLKGRFTQQMIDDQIINLEKAFASLEVVETEQPLTAEKADVKYPSVKTGDNDQIHSYMFMPLLVLITSVMLRKKKLQR